jgi:hypothetical protein
VTEATVHGWSLVGIMLGGSVAILGFGAGPWSTLIGVFVGQITFAAAALFLVSREGKPRPVRAGRTSRKEPMTAADPILDRLVADDPPEMRNDPAYREAVKGTFAYQRAVLEDAARAFGREFVEHVGGAFRKIDEKRDEALARWWRDPR